MKAKSASVKIIKEKDCDGRRLCLPLYDLGLSARLFFLY